MPWLYLKLIKNKGGGGGGGGEGGGDITDYC